MIIGAGYGDETSWTDISSFLQTMLKDKGYINVIADASLVPKASERVSITDEEKEEILKNAELQCGGGMDKKCIEERTDTLSKAKLAQKADETKIVKGEKLSVAVLENGRYRVEQIAKGQPFVFGKVPGTVKPQTAKEDSTIMTYVGYAIALFIWGLSIFLTWFTFQSSSTYVRYGVTAIAAVFPLSGFLIITVYYLLLVYKQRQNA